MIRKPGSRLRGIGFRVYSDFLMGSRLSEYRNLLAVAVDSGYYVARVDDLADHSVNRASSPVMVLRHDLDTDAATAREMWLIESELGLTSTYFFRLSTLQPEFMRELDASGCEVGYHYEELSTAAKNRGAASADEAALLLNEARENFARNLAAIRSVTRLSLVAAAAHGDFINRRLGVSNKLILEDPSFRLAMGIKYEAYDQLVNEAVASRHSDSLAPTFWRNGNPVDAVLGGLPVIYLLVHPRHWRARLWVNLRDDLWRGWEGTRYEFVRAIRTIGD